MTKFIFVSLLQHSPDSATKNYLLIYKSCLYLSRRMTKPTYWPVRPAKTQISLGIGSVCSDTSRSAWRSIGPLAIPKSAQLIWVYAWSTGHFVCFCLAVAQFSYISRDMTKPTKWACAQRRLRSAWATAQSDQSLHCPHEESLCPELPIKRTAKTLIRLGGYPGWSESSLGAQSYRWFSRDMAHITFR